MHYSYDYCIFFHSDSEIKFTNYQFIIYIMYNIILVKKNSLCKKAILSITINSIHTIHTG